MRVLHTQLLVRGGARTPLRPLQPDTFWKACLPTGEQLQRLLREGGSGSVGARRSRWQGRPSSAAEERLRESEPWGQLTTRGADEARAVGSRLERWMAERAIREGPNASAELEPGPGEEPDEKVLGTPRQGAAGVTALATPDLRGELTARATIGGLVLPPDVRVPVDTLVGSRLRVGHLLEGVLGGPAELDGWLEGAGLGAGQRRDVALDLVELLGLGSDAVSMLDAAGWPTLLDVAECTSIFGQLPRGELAKSTRRALFRAPRLAAQALLKGTLVDSDASSAVAGPALGPLLQTLVAPSVRAARGLSRERLRITVLPGFSMLCWAHAMGLERAMVWPAPSTCFLVETLVDDAVGKVFLRVWLLRDQWEIRPTWHAHQGPLLLSSLLRELAPLLGPMSQALGRTPEGS